MTPQPSGEWLNFTVKMPTALTPQHPTLTMPTSNEDMLYTASRHHIEPFQFDAEVANVFEDMIQRSVPGYAMMLEMIGVISNACVQVSSHCYDLGCSLGASTEAIRQQLPFDNCKIIGVDNSAPMLEQCRSNLDRLQASAIRNGSNSPGYHAQLELRCEDILDTSISQASLVVMNFTLQFIKPQQRQKLLNNIAKGMLGGGTLILSEKISLANSDSQELLSNLHHGFKRNRGYSDLEIAQKRSALEDVLIPDSLDCHRERLHQAGFSKVEVWFQCFNFVSLIAIK